MHLPAVEILAVEQGDGFQGPDPDAPIPDVPAVVLEADGPGRRAAVTRIGRELAGRDQFLPFRRAELVFHRLHPVQPVLHVVVQHPDAALVPFAGSVQGLLARGVQVVVVAGEMFVHVHRAHRDVGVVVEHLILGGVEPDFGTFLLDHPVEDAAVGHLGEPELEPEVEVGEGFGGDDVPAHRDVRVRGRRAHDEHAVDDPPSGVRKLFPVVPAPPRGRLPVEEETPARGSFGLGEGVGRSGSILGGGGGHGLGDPAARRPAATGCGENPRQERTPDGLHVVTQVHQTSLMASGSQRTLRSRK